MARRSTTPSGNYPVSPKRQVFAASLERARKAAGLTQAELAEKSGVSQPHVSALERGAWEPRLATIMALAKALNVSRQACCRLSIRAIPTSETGPFTSL